MPDIAQIFNPVPGSNCPVEADLQTGDILFPRLPGPVATASLVEASELAFLDPYRQRSLRQLEQESLKRWLQLQQSTGIGDDPPAIEAVTRRGGIHAPTSSAGGMGLDLGDWRTLQFLLRILRANLPDLFEDWFDITIEQLIKKYRGLLRLLIGALGQDMRDGFFVGHCALVLRQPDDDPAGAVYVIEANITDYAHYGVSIHPYLDPGDPHGNGSNAQRMRGWANYRAALGQDMWARRPKPLDTTARTAQDVKTALARHAKALLGRPYGFFDSPRFGDTDRLYCSEFIHTAMIDTAAALQGSHPGLALDLDDHRSWRWLLDNLGSSDFANQVRDSLTPELLALVEEKPFFILTVHMLWRSEKLRELFTPQGQGPYA